jgi:hypothetical protein
MSMTKLSIGGVFSRKNMNLIVGLLSLLIFLWLVSYAIPSLFVYLFETGLGNLILLGFIVLAGLFNMNLGVGLAVVFFILYRFAHMGKGLFEGLTQNATKKPPRD